MIYVLLILGALVMVMPLVWMVLTSLKTVTESTAMNPFRFLPADPQWENFQSVAGKNDFIRLYINTFAMMGLRVLCAVMFSLHVWSFREKNWGLAW